MLQQTQVERVVPKYQDFIKQFGTARRLAAAPLGIVLKAWQGLGYNRRAKYLWQAAQTIVEMNKGIFPNNESGLRSLPGVGPYTASAIMAFAYNEPVALIETNVRQVFLYHYFSRKEGVHDTDILKLVERTVPAENAREWYWALMDYGSHLKQQYGNLTQKSKHYTKQSKFHGSDRQIRGAIIRILASTTPLTKKKLEKELSFYEAERVTKQLRQLCKECLVTMKKGLYQLA